MLRALIKEHKKTIRVWVIIFLTLAALIFGPHLLWTLKEARQISTVVVDKTMPFTKYREHENVHWLLRAWKITDKKGRFLEPETDYLGFDPVQKIGHDLEPEHLANADVLFITDTYGVYIKDYEKPGDVAALERSPKIYGGFSVKEAHAIRDFADRGGLVVGEFNTFASPTEGEARATMEGVFGARWTHWVARYWPNVQDGNEVPKWIGKVYTRVFKRPFDIEGPALIFVRDDVDMIVLQPGIHITDEVITMYRTQAAPELDGLPKTGAFWFWLDVVEPIDGEVIYQYRIEATEEGLKELSDHGVPVEFPAMLRRRSSWYIAGDVVDNATEKGDPERVGLLTWRRYTSGVFGSPLDAGFLWGWYAPVLERIVYSSPGLQDSASRR